jgi:hypothetical protein
MRHMSFAMTKDAILDRSKDVTRRDGWDFLKPGDRVLAVEKAMGLKKGEKHKALAIIEIVSAAREPLMAMRKEPGACKREGFPAMTPDSFMYMLHKANPKIHPAFMINRIEFRYVDEN